MENGEMVILLLETLDMRIADARRSGVYKKMTDPRSLVNWVLWGLELTTGLTLKGKVIGSFRYLALERTQTSARPGNCRGDSGEWVPYELSDSSGNTE